MNKDTEVYTGNPDIPIDYEFLAEDHEILESHIGTKVHSLKENPVLKEYFIYDLFFRGPEIESGVMIKKTTGMILTSIRMN